MKKTLDLGCGNRKKEGMIGIDINPNTDADIIHDLNIFPYPFEESTFDEIYADNVIEHLDNPIKVMEELHRISKSGASIIIKVPYFRSRYAFIDPTHRHFFTVESFTYFDPEHSHHTLFNYSEFMFETKKIIFDENLYPKNLRHPIHSILKYFCDKYPVFYEHHLSHLVPLDELTFYLKTIKLGKI
ncbi:class I SAM-dependent methyltransferase [Methanoplanus endosymbiosus]|uniref:Class I SAM-dependent methyltransferase n=1 Tax=Methanoplanus endosymbiosus TaxID=33865 RepID=A0A9E7PKG2_9EURY|nr:class I SAM-dependent methyltransferase [Methanoplanus endosymbiosus]UUX91683.1 class I SAM-dependent methyltransferase [Methanoplanus endosymbiosus]